MNVENLKEARKKEGLSQFDLAVKIGLTSNAIAHMEQGRREPSMKTLRKMAEVLKIDPGKLI